MKKKKNWTEMSVFGEVQLGMSRAVSDDEDDEYAGVGE